ncbi:MAG: ABC transporter substrate-binding protein [Nitrospirota bacterium]
MKLNRLRHFFIFFASFSFLTSCYSCSPVNRPDGYIYLRLNSNPTTLDPAFIVDVAGGNISSKLFNGLVKLDENLSIVPDIAESWEIEDNGKTYIFHLKHGVFFTNNQEVTSSDFKYSFKRILSPQNTSPNTWVLDKISGAKDYLNGRAEDLAGFEIIDKYTFRIRLERPFIPFLNLLAMTAAYVVPQEEVERRGADFSSSPVGTGPFMLGAWKHNNEIVLARNNNYFMDKAKVDGIIYRIIPEDLTAVTEFELGNLDVIDIPASVYAKYRKSSKWQNLIESAEGLNTYYLGFNCSRPPFDNSNLRKAAAFAIDRKKILETFYEKRGVPASGPVPDTLRKWDPPDTYEYNPEKARRIVEEEWMRRKDVEFYITSDREVADMAEIIQFYLEKAGFEIKIIQLEWSAYKSALNKGEADMFWMSWWADYPDPENFLFPLFHSSNHGSSGNRTQYTNREVDSFINKGQASRDLQERNRYYMQAEKIIAKESPCIFFWHKKHFALRQPYLKDYRIYPIHNMDKGLEVFF